MNVLSLINNIVTVTPDNNSEFPGIIISAVGNQDHIELSPSNLSILATQLSVIAIESFLETSANHTDLSYANFQELIQKDSQCIRFERYTKSDSTEYTIIKKYTNFTGWYSHSTRTAYLLSSSY